jgi:hypothetical protein
MARRPHRPHDPANPSSEARTFRTRKLGRPSKGPDALSAPFTIRVKPAERARFEALAAAAGLSLTAWARRMLLAAADRLEGRTGGSKGGGKGSGGR